MALAETLDVGLKEWAVVCRALRAGRQIVLLRKGGIYEAGGEFEVEHPRFLLFPTYLHQKLEMLKEGDRAGFEARSAEPEQVELREAAEVTDILEVKKRAQVEAVDGEHVWTKPLIDMRFNYRPENPLYLLVLRVYSLAHPVTIPNTVEYAGCKSWVPLEAEVDVQGSAAVVGDALFEQRRRFIREAFERAL